MRVALLLPFTLFSTILIAQSPCYQHSRLFLFNKADEPRLFTDPLGRHPSFPFLQRKNGVISPETFVQSIRDPIRRQTYTRTFKAFDLLLRNAGFWHGYKDLTTRNIRKVYITPGTIGNLGFYNPQSDVINYLYVKLEPAGESGQGIEAWKLINKKGCFLYILFTCGNAFYPNADAVVEPPTESGGATQNNRSSVKNPAGGETSSCCSTLTIHATSNGSETNGDSVNRYLQLTINQYVGRLTPSRRKSRGYDTAVSLRRSRDTTILLRAGISFPPEYDSTFSYKIYRFCHDSTVEWNLTQTTAAKNTSAKPVRLIFSDTLFQKESVPEAIEETDCENDWEVCLDMGKAWNSFPRFDDPTQHTQSNGSQLAATVEISRILTPWFHLGISGAYLVLAYQDDVNYPGYAGGYNTVYLGNQLSPYSYSESLYLANQPGFNQASNYLSVTRFQRMGKIVNNGVTLSTAPNLKGDFTAALKFGIAYFFSCHVGVGASFSGEYFNNKSDLIAYSLYALPFQGGLRIRF